MKNGQPRPRSSHPAELRRSGKFVNINKIFELIDISPNPAQSGTIRHNPAQSGTIRRESGAEGGRGTSGPFFLQHSGARRV